MTNKSNKRQSSFHWGSLLFGMLIGIFITSLIVFMFSTSDITLKIPTGRKQVISDTLASKDTNQTEVVQQQQEPRFDFYTELAKNTPSSTPPPDLKSTTKTINGYVVQAGLFKKGSDADALKAKLTLSGYEAKIEKFRQRDGELWHRVVLGPYKNENVAKVLITRLKKLEVDAVLMLKYTE